MAKVADLERICSVNFDNNVRIEVSSLTCMVCDVSMIMSVSVGEDPFEMYVTFIRSCC